MTRDIDKYIGALLLFLIGTTTLLGQHGRCGHDRLMEATFQANPEYEKSIEQGFKDFAIRNKEQLRAATDVVTIPVHVIIVHPPGQAIGQGSNLSLARIQSQIIAMNKDFRRLNPDSVNTPQVFDVGDTYIEFAIAQLDPSGNPTDGVSRYATSDDFDDFEFNIKDSTRWDRDTYLNIWVAPSLDDLGFALVPSTNSLPNINRDGCAVLTSAFGGPGFATFVPYHLGRTTTHEVGHYLGLRHIWRNGGCGLDDGISDTPLQDDSNFGCPNHPSTTCNNSGDMFMNYMDYVNDNCMNAFTKEQGAYMRQILNTSRSSLLTAADRALTGTEVLSLAVEEANDPDCFDTFTGSITVVSTGGAGNNRYKINSGPSQSSPVFNFLKAGTYEIEVFDNASTNRSLEVTLTDPPLLTFQQEDKVDALCARSFGSIDVQAIGGVVNDAYSYTLSSGETTSDGRFAGLEPGTYQVTATDDNACTVETELIINSPDSLKISILNQSNVDCENTSGNIELNFDGGTMPYQTKINGSTFTGDKILDLTPNQYLIELEDANGCFVSEEVEIVELEAISILSTEVDQVSCFAVNDGRITVIPNNFVEGLMYKINDGNLQSSSQFDNLSEGIYKVFVYSGSCVDSTSIEIMAPDAIDVVVDEIRDPLCPNSADGRLVIRKEEADSIASFSLNLMTNSDGVFENLLPGAYALIVTDVNNCTAEQSINLTAKSDLEIVLDITAVSCFGLADGGLKIEGLGGFNAQGYQYSVNGNNFSSSQSFFGYDSGRYAAFVRDSAACVVSDSFDILEPDSLFISTIVENSDASIEVIYSGGTPPYEFSLDDVSYQEDSIFIGNSRGDVLTVYVKDANGCISTKEHLIVSNQKIALAKEIKIYPNPNSGILYFKIEDDLVDNLSFSLYNCLGQKQAFFFDVQSRNMDLTNFSNGVYFLNIQVGEESTVKKIILAK